MLLSYSLPTLDSSSTQGNSLVAGQRLTCIVPEEILVGSQPRESNRPSLQVALEREYSELPAARDTSAPSK